MASQSRLGGLHLRNTRRTVASVALPSFELALLAPLLERLQTEHFESSLLCSLPRQMTTSSGHSWKEIRTLNLWVWLLDLRQSEYLALALDRHVPTPDSSTIQKVPFTEQSIRESL